MLCFKDQDIKELEGDYRLYWNENHELLENKTIEDLIGNKKIDSFRRFWYGDAFIVRCSEHPETFAYDVHDTSSVIFQHSALKDIFQDMWKNQFLEAELKDDRAHNSSEEKIEADKEIILGRM